MTLTCQCIVIQISYRSGCDTGLQVADELLADADAARAMARDAIAKAEKTLEDAKKALRTFRGMSRFRAVITCTSSVCNNILPHGLMCR